MKGREEVTMKKTMLKRLMSWVLAAAMVVAMLPVSVLGAEPGGSVAKIGDTEYATFAAAAEAVKEGETIELLQDCNSGLTKAWAIDKKVTITGNYTVTFDTYSFGLNGNGVNGGAVLTLNGCHILINNASYTAYSDDPANAAIMLTEGAKIVLDNGASLIVDGAKGDGFATWDSINQEYSDTIFEEIVIRNGSRYEFKNGTNGGGFEDYNGGEYDVPINDVISVEGNCEINCHDSYSGIIATWNVYVNHSILKVFNNSGNGSNGSNYYISNGSQVTFEGNGSHGISAADLKVETGSTVTASKNGYYGAYSSGNFLVDGTSKMIVTGNSAKGDYAGLKLTAGVTDGKVEAGAVVTITDNYCSGLSNNGVCVFEEGAKLTIMNNKNDKGTSSHGGGIYNSGASAKLTLPSDAVIYNNHSKTDGDDIFNNTTATITFGKVGSDWVLDDCDHLIDGWYLDGEGDRWQVCNLAEGEDPYAKEYVLENATATVTGLTALKAAHGYDPVDKASYPSLDKKVGDNDEEMNDVDVDAAAGQKVSFQLTSNVPTDLLNYLNPKDVTPPSIDGEEPGTAEKVEIAGRGEYTLTFHDKLNAMLTNSENYVVKIGDTELTAEQYEVLTPADGCSFEISLDLAALYKDGVIADDDIEKATPITVTYDATLSAEAVAGEYENEAWVTAPEWTTEKDIVYVNTYAIDIFKYDQANNTGLAGAEFELKNSEGVVISTVTSGQDGYAVIDGLDAGTYYLTEIKAPEGYVKSDTPLTIIIPKDADGENVVSVSFANSQIPHTGGTGTLMFTIGGAAIIATAGVLLLVSRKKRKA